ncbi:MAG: hypothetical protein JXA81_07210 [Sedimentisphaerales bacterium]|nr:hypothetical protein [Sedimentisphaerales bacterium]
MKDFGSIVKICVCVFVAMSLCFIPSCKKSEPAGTESSQQSISAAQPKTPAPSADKPVAKAPEKPAEPGTEPVAEEPAEVEKSAERRLAPEEPAAPANITGFVPIDIKLPKPMFVGTPQDTKVPNLEKPLGKARPPFLAPEGTTNVALGKPIASSDEEPIIGEIEMITDGDKEAADGSYVELGPFVQYVTIDLEAMYDIYAIVVWHYHKQARVYFDTVVQVADDADFITNVKTVFNNDIDNSAGLGVGKDMHYTETNEGKLIDVLSQGIKARYVRLYSNGNTSNDLNHYIEVEVYGKPVK